MGAMKTRDFVGSVVLALALALAGGRSAAQVQEGDSLETPDLRGLAQTPAKSAGDFVGRAVLYEFFAYW